MGFLFQGIHLGRICISSLPSRARQRAHTSRLIRREPGSTLGCMLSWPNRVKDECVKGKPCLFIYKAPHTAAVQKVQPFLCLSLTCTAANKANLRPLRNWLLSRLDSLQDFPQCSHSDFLSLSSLKCKYIIPLSLLCIPAPQLGYGFNRALSHPLPLDLSGQGGIKWH